jgi:hypothetical protein
LIFWFPEVNSGQAFFIKKKEHNVLLINLLMPFFFLIKRNKNQGKTKAMRHAAPSPACFAAPNPPIRVHKRSRGL